MKKLIYISFIFAFMLAFTSCDKEVIEPIYQEDGSARHDNSTPGQRGGENGDLDYEDPSITITDPDEDEDFDKDENIVDPDEDEDFEEQEGGK